MPPSLKFVFALQPTSHAQYYVCADPRTQIQIIITTRVKILVERGQWFPCSPEDQEEIRSLYELGFLISTAPGHQTL